MTAPISKPPLASPGRDSRSADRYG